MASETVQGKVKWFNSRAGYGFITVISEQSKDEDIFVHHSSLKCSAEQYKYLIQGEYVDFVITETKDEKHKFQADRVTGINGGDLMCETRNNMSMKKPGNNVKRGNRKLSETVVEEQ
tara:strand:- start:704 stop:1054 length:351 start_codon:yes stop_codon:yes gene_type:complete